MPRIITLAAAGRYILDNPPFVLSGRGSTANRATTLAALSVAKLTEHLFEGGTSTWLDDEIGTLDLATNVEAAHGDSRLTFASVDSVGFSKTTNMYAGSATQTYGTGIYAWEMWMKPPGWVNLYTAFIGMLVGQNTNQYTFLGKYGENFTRIFNFPIAVNKFNNTIFWESKYDIDDTIILQIVEAHEIATRANFIVVINGIPVASGTNTGMLSEWEVYNQGPQYNGRPGAPAADLGAQKMASATWYDNGQTLTLQDIRELYETSALLGQDMLTLPHWVVGDAENTTLVDDGITDAIATLGDVTDATGIRSGAIPRTREKIYFEMEIVAQGDAINAIRPGIRRMITAADVGDQTTVGENGSKHHWYVDGDDIHVDRGTDTNVDVDAGSIGQATGVIIMFAINWASGKFWIGRNGVWGDNSGDPATGANPLDTLDKNTNWAAHIFNNGALGNGVVKLITKFHEMRYPVPQNFDSWVQQIYSVETTIYGIGRRQAAIDWTGTIPHLTWLLEGGVPDYLNDSGERLRDRPILTDGIGTAATHGGLQLSYASVDSVRWPRTVNAEARHLSTFNLQAHAFELWFRQPDFSQSRCCLVGGGSNSNVGVGNGLGTRNFPAFNNNFNDSLLWESEIDIYGDNKIHCLMELCDYDNYDQLLVILDGMPVASVSTGGWFAEASPGVKFNDDQNDGDTYRSGGDYGSWHEYRGGRTIDLFAARRIFEASGLPHTLLAKVGLESGLILDAQLSASSEFDAARGPEFGRLNNADGSHWSSLSTGAGEWWKIDFGEVVTIESISTQGGGGTVNWVTSYNIDYNDDDSVSWTAYSGNTLTGNTDEKSVVKNALTPFTCRYLRVLPITWNTTSTMRLEFEKAISIGQDMLTSPQWCTLDAINSTIDGTGKKDCLNADVTDNTGCRSYAIPRDGKVYFEVEILAQGDTTSSCLLGLRKLAESSNVGFDPDIATDEYHTDGLGGVEDGQDVNLTITGTLGTCATGRIFQFAIDWFTGDWWMGTDNTLWAGEGGTGNPSTGANPLTALDNQHNWAVILRVNGINGNGKCRLITTHDDFNYVPPTDFLGWEPPVDPLFANVVLLVRSVSATHGQITFADESNDANSLVREGQTIYDATATYFQATASMLFDGSGNDSVFIPDSANLTLDDRTLEFCVEAWIYVTDIGSANTIIGGRDTGSAEEWMFRTGGAVILFAVYAGGSTIAVAQTGNVLTVNTWHHVAATRENVAGDGLITIYVDGVSEATDTQTGNGTTNVNGYHIGHNEYNTSRDFTGHIDSVRVTRGDIRYAGAFTPPTIPFPTR